MYVDSGAAETVITEQMLSAIKLHEGTQSRRGVTYEVANGVTIPNLGENKSIAHTGRSETWNNSTSVRGEQSSTERNEVSATRK